MGGRGRKARGFTLIEIIIAIVVAGFLGVLMVNMMGTQLLKSFTPVTVAQDTATAESILEVVQAYYVKHVNSNTSGTLDAVYSQFSGNSSISMTRNASGTFTGDTLDSLTVQATAGSVTLKTILTQERQGSSDNAVSY